ncbi:MAG: class I SAM-dependent methyltransferase [Myxococcota bacterium]
MPESEDPSQFYTGLVADLYEPLASQPTRAEDYVPFLALTGTPALELACGSGRPLVELVERGYEVEGLDSSEDMLELCRARAAERGTSVVLHRATMQSFSLQRRYASIFLAGASFTLLVSDEDAAAALERIHAHLLPGGAALIPLEIPDESALRSALGRSREVRADDSALLRITPVALEASEDGRAWSRTLRYERIAPDGSREVVERTWHTRWWSQAQFTGMLLEAGFEAPSFLAPEGGEAPADASVFVALARRPD